MEIFLYLDYFQYCSIIIFFKEFMENFEKLKSSEILKEEGGNETIFVTTIVYEASQYGGKEKSGTILASDLKV